MKAAWSNKPLGAICGFSNGLWTGKKPPFEEAIVVRNTNFRPHGRLDHSDVALLSVEAKQLAKRRLKHGDIIIEKSGGGPKQPVGRVAYFDKIDGVYSFSNFASLRVKRQDRTMQRTAMRHGIGRDHSTFFASTSEVGVAMISRNCRHIRG